MQATIDLGRSHIAALVIDESDVDAVKRALRDNRIGELGHWDLQALHEQLGALGVLEDGGLGFDLPTLDDLFGDTELGLPDAPAGDPPPKPEDAPAPAPADDDEPPIPSRLLSRSQNAAK